MVAHKGVATMNNNREIAEVLLADRQFIYSLLHKSFGRDPDADMMEILLSDSTKEAFAILSEEENDVFARTPRFIDELKKDMAEDADFVSKLKSEYTKLFVGPLDLVAPPWESIYTGKEGMLFTVTTLRVREFYRSFGLIPEGYPRVADDSLALELAFMSELSNRAVKAFAEEKDDELKNLLSCSALFLKEHLLEWVPQFLEKMKDAPSDYMYPQLSVILNAFIKKDEEIIEELLKLI